MGLKNHTGKCTPKLSVMRGQSHKVKLPSMGSVGLPVRLAFVTRSNSGSCWKLLMMQTGTPSQASWNAPSTATVTHLPAY